MQGKSENDRNHARRGDQRADRHAEDEGEDRQRSAEIDDAHDEVLEKTCLPGLALEDEVDAHEADDRPCQMHPPEQLRGYDQKRAGLLSSIAFESMRRDVVGDQNGGHHKEERDLDDEAGVRTTAGNQVPDDDAGEADQIQLHEWRRKERVKRHLTEHALPPEEEDRLRCQIWEERPRRRAPARTISVGQCLLSRPMNEFFLIRIEDEHGEQARGFRVLAFALTP